MADQLSNELSDADLDLLLASGDVEAIEKYLGGEDKSEQPETPEVNADYEAAPADLNQDSDKPVEPEPKNKEDEKQDSEPSNAEGDEPAQLSQQNSEERYVESKSGGNKIPYAVLEGARKRASEAETQLQDALRELQDLKSQSTVMSKHLEKNGIDLEALQKGGTISDEIIAKIADADPDVARGIEILNENFRNLSEKVQSFEGQNVVSPVELAIKSNSDLDSWRKSDTDRWETAVQYDDLLKQDPAFKDASLEERFAEAVKRTKQLFGDAQQSKTQPADPQKNAALAEQKVKEAQANSAPRSLTDIGVSPSTQRSQAEVFGDLSADEIASKMDSMSAAEIDRLLAESERL